VRDEGRAHNTEVEIDDEYVHITRKFGSNNSFPSRSKNQPCNDDPDKDDDALDNKCRNGSFEKGEFRNSPELEMPAVNERPEDE